MNNFGIFGFFFLSKFGKNKKKRKSKLPVGYEIYIYTYSNIQRCSNILFWTENTRDEIWHLHLLQYTTMFKYSFFNRKYPLWGYLVKKIKIVCLSWNLVPRVLQIRWFQRQCAFFLFWTASILFGEIWSKKSKLCIWDKGCDPH